MPITEADVDAMKLRIMDLEKLVGEIGNALKTNPDSAALAKRYEEAKDEITKLNLRIEHLEKPRSKSNGGTHVDSEEDIWPC